MVLHYCKNTIVNIFLKVLPQQGKGFKTSPRGNTFKRKKDFIVITRNLE
jgi:hypothetical protein